VSLPLHLPVVGDNREAATAGLRHGVPLRALIRPPGWRRPRGGPAPAPCSLHRGKRRSPPDPVNLRPPRCTPAGCGLGRARRRGDGGRRGGRLELWWMQQGERSDRIPKECSTTEAFAHFAATDATTVGRATMAFFTHFAHAAPDAATAADSLRHLLQGPPKSSPRALLYWVEREKAPLRWLAIPLDGPSHKHRPGFPSTGPRALLATPTATSSQRMPPRAVMGEPRGRCLANREGRSVKLCSLLPAMLCLELGGKGVAELCGRHLCAQPELDSPALELDSCGHGPNPRVPPHAALHVPLPTSRDLASRERNRVREVTDDRDGRGCSRGRTSATSASVGQLRRCCLCGHPLPCSTG
jgi:hypothetical protein